MEFTWLVVGLLLCREDCIVPHGSTQHPPAGGSGCLYSETSLDIMLFPTAWVVPVDDTGNAKYRSALLPVPLSFFFFSFPVPLLFRSLDRKREWKRCAVLPGREGRS